MLNEGAHLDVCLYKFKFKNAIMGGYKYPDEHFTL